MKQIIKKSIPYIAAGLIVLGSFFTGAVTDLGDATKIALDKNEATKACIELINASDSNLSK